MESIFQMTNNGQEIQQADLNLLGTTSGLADDRTLAELIRLLPYDGVNVARGIMPYVVNATGTSAAAPATFAVLASNGATGSVYINPFRAFVGSRTPVASGSTANWRDIRSTFALGSSTALPKVLALNANATGNPRWTLVYVAIQPDQNGPSVTRYIKDPTTGAEASTGVVSSLVTQVSIGTVDGTAAASPTFPAIPSDGAGSYYIPLGYVRVPNGFNAGSIVGVNDIYETAPVVTLAHSTGVATLAPASCLNQPTGSLQTRIPWPASGNRPAPFLPPSMCGGKSVILSLQFGNSLTASALHGDVLDNSIDWRKRMFRWFVQVVSGSTRRLSQDKGVTIAGNCPSANSTAAGSARYSTDHLFGFGQSLFPENFNGSAALTVARINNGDLASVNAAGNFEIQVHATTGALILYYTAGVDCQAFLWIDATAPMANY